MFNRKPAPPAQPAAPAKPAPAAASAPPPSGWQVLAFTTDYGVMGYLAPTDTPLVGFLNISTQPTITLTHAQLQAYQPTGLSLEKLPEATLPKAALLALVPRDEASARSAAQQMAGQGHQAVLYIGPLVIKATVPLIGNMPLRNAFTGGAGDMMAISNAEVHCQIPGTRLPDLKTPILIINKRLTQVFYPA